MIYRDYINQFTVDEETKATVFKKLKQREQQLKEVGENNAVTSPALKKKNSFTMHRKRWIAVATSLAVVAAATPIVYFSISNINENKVNPYSVSLDYMTNLMVDVNGVTAYSIRKDISTSSRSAPAESNKAVSLLSASVVYTSADNENADVKSSYCLYSTNENYTNGNIEYDSNGIKKVTFIKNSEIGDDVYDDEGNLIDSDREITQEELDGRINKIFTTKQYTYMQFVAPVKKSGNYAYKDSDGNIRYEKVNLRPESMTYDAEGVAEFDKSDYYSSNLTASFVIDNLTGYIYKIENFHIKSFHNGLVVNNDGYYYSVKTDAEHNLIFTDVMPNKDVTVNNVVLDNYGWTFVANEFVDSVDAERKIIYTTNRKYVVDSDRNIYVSINNEHSGNFRILKTIVDGIERPFENTGIIRNLAGLHDNRYSWRDLITIGVYQDLYVDNFRVHVAGYGVQAAYNDETHAGLYMYIYNGVSCRYYWLDDNYDTIIAQTGGICYYSSVNLADYRNDSTILHLDKDFNRLSDLKLTEAEDYYLSVGSDRYKINNVYYHVDANTTDYYQLVKTVDGVELVELTSKSYTDNVFIFQPINK